MLEASLCELANDILANGLRTSIVIWSDPDDKRELLIDGRNRLDALAIARLLSVDDEGRLCTPRWSDDQQCWISTPERIKCQYVSGGDPYAIALSFNLHRRHLTSAQKRDLISKVLKARPEVSNATVAKQTMADDKTVAKVRRKLEATSEIPRLEKTTGRDGRSRPATTKGKSRAPSQKAGGIAGRTVTADSSSAASWQRSPDSSRNAPMVIPLRDREQPTKEANPARSQAHPARASAISQLQGPVSCTGEISARSQRGRWEKLRYRRSARSLAASLLIGCGSPLVIPILAPKGQFSLTHPSYCVCKRSISAADTSAVCDQHWVEEKRGIASHLPRAAIGGIATNLPTPSRRAVARLEMTRPPTIHVN